MNRHEAIEELKRLKQGIQSDFGWNKSGIEALEMAIQALQTEPCEDAISRQAVMNTIYRECSGENLNIDFAKVLLLQRKIKALQPVQT